jgi:hypothetical protein
MNNMLAEFMVSESNGVDPVFKAAKLLLPRLAAHLKNARPEIIVELSKRISTALHYVATGEEEANGDPVPTSVDSGETDTPSVSDRAPEVRTRITGGRNGVRKVNSRGVSVVAVRRGVSESPSPSGGFEAEVPSGVPDNGSVSEETVSTLGSRSVSAQFDATGFRDESE